MIPLLRSELRKVFTTRLWWGLLLGLTVVWALQTGLLAALVGRSGVMGPDAPRLGDAATFRSTYTAGLSIAYVFALTFGVIAMSGETRHQTLTATMLAAPRRGQVVLAKLGAVVLVGLGYGIAGVLTGVVVGAPVFAARHAGTGLGADGVPQALVSAAIAVALWAVVGLGVGTLIRNQIVAVLLSIGLAWIAEPIIAVVLNLAKAGAVARFLPSQATSALVRPAASQGVEIDLLPWWGGAAVLLGYALLSGALGAALTLRRDIT